MPTPFGHFQRSPFGNFVRSPFGDFDGQGKRCQNVPAPGQWKPCCLGSGTTGQCIEGLSSTTCAQIGGTYRNDLAFGTACRKATWFPPTAGTCQQAQAPTGACCLLTDYLTGPFANDPPGSSCVMVSSAANCSAFNITGGFNSSGWQFNQTATFNGLGTVCPYGAYGQPSCAPRPPGELAPSPCPSCPSPPGYCIRASDGAKVGIGTQAYCQQVHPGTTWRPHVGPYVCYLLGTVTDLDLTCYPADWNDRIQFGACCRPWGDCNGNINKTQCTKSVFWTLVNGNGAMGLLYNQEGETGQFFQGKSCHPDYFECNGGGCCLGCNYCVDGFPGGPCQLLGGEVNAFQSCTPFGCDV